jgi:mannosyl-3-phosphoglycerate phosphatase
VSRQSNDITEATGDHKPLLNPSSMAMTQTVFFTDLDGCLLDNTGDSIESARPACIALRSHHIPLILVSGKTRAEIEPLRQRLDHRDPFIVEDGAAVFVPLGTFDFPLERSRQRSSYQVIELGTPYAMLREVLRQIEEAVQSPLPGFGDLSLEDIMRATGLSQEQALRAKLREYGEPFLMKGPSTLIEEVYRQIGLRDLRCSKGEHFFHLTGSNSRTRAADILLRCYRRKWQDEGRQLSLETVVIGENLQDLPVLVRDDRADPAQSSDGSSQTDIKTPRLIRAHGAGPAAWSDAVLDLLKHAA